MVFKLLPIQPVIILSQVDPQTKLPFKIKQTNSTNNGIQNKLGLVS